MKLLFEKSRTGRASAMLPVSDVPHAPLDAALLRAHPPRLPELAEPDITRHYSALARRAYGVNDGFYPLGSCTMKYNPRINEEVAALPGFTQVHPLQPVHTMQGSLRALCRAEALLCELTGMDAMSFQPAAGAHGELTGLLLIQAYHAAHGDTARTKILVPDSAHGTNPASAAMAGYAVVNIPSNAQGRVDLNALRAAVGADTAGLMLTNPNTVGMFEQDIAEITQAVHDAGGLNYYDGANLNAIMGISRPGDMGFDVVHLNLHKTFSTPHGGGGPGAGPVGCKALLREFLPLDMPVRGHSGYELARPAHSIGRVRSFYGNFLVVVRALAYLLSLGGEGLREAAQQAVLNANYLKHRLEGVYEAPYKGICMHEFVLSARQLKQETGVSALDLAKGMVDAGLHPPTMYFPLIVPEALMLEPTETESKETLDEAAELLLGLARQAHENPQALHAAPRCAQIRRPDDVQAARKPRLRYRFDTDTAATQGER